MRYKRELAVAVSIVMAIGVVPVLSSAHESTTIIITEPQEGADPMSCAVYFADNMVYAPQWRVGNFVRIETMVLDMTGCTDAVEFDVDGLWLPEFVVRDESEGLLQQAALIADSNRLNETKMVSVSYIEVQMTGPDEYESETFSAGWMPSSPYTQVIDNGLGREINKGGHLIYGMLWDTTHVPAGEYTVSVRLGKAVQDSDGDWVGEIGQWYDVDYCVANYYIAEDQYNDPDHPFVSITSDPFDPLYVDYKVGLGGLDGDTAWILLGPLIPQGSGGGYGGGGNGGEGNGNGGGDGGNGNGNLGNRNGHRK